MFLVYGHTTEIVSVVYEYIISVAACSNRSNGCGRTCFDCIFSSQKRQIDKISQSMDVYIGSSKSRGHSPCCSSTCIKMIRYPMTEVKCNSQSDDGISQCKGANLTMAALLRE